MIRHVVTFTLAEQEAQLRATQVQWIGEQLRSLIPLVPEIVSLDVYPDVVETPGNAHVVLVADYADQAALDRYQVHPDHKRVAAGIRPLLTSRASIDYLV